jgi:HD-GYP domain-containing protein (c-di-GMP phosphodiesterase class II)
MRYSQPVPPSVSSVSRVEELVAALESEKLAGWTIGRLGDGELELLRGEERVVAVDAGRITSLVAAADGPPAAVIALGGADELTAPQVAEAIAALGASPVWGPAPLSCIALALEAAAGRCRAELSSERARRENDLLIAVGRSLSQERDIDSLLAEILRTSRAVTGADAGSVYVVEGEGDDPSAHALRFAAFQNDSMPIPSAGFTIPVSPSSIAGACVLGREVINIPDLYALDEPGTGNNPWGFVHDRSFDDNHGYQTRSMLAVPMISAREQVIGVIQLINKKRQAEVRLGAPADFVEQVVPFDKVSENYAATLASQAGIALENALLYDEVRQLFEGFVHASVTAIESRDPTTSGHSQRVADLTVGLAKVVDRVDRGPYANLKLSPTELKQLEYAALLHDFGKVGVRENVLVKPRKLYEHERELIEARFRLIRRTLEAEHSRQKVSYLLEASRDAVAEKLAALDRDAEVKIRELDEFFSFILQANEPTVLEKGGFERLQDIAARRYVDVDGKERPYLTTEERAALEILKGSLTPEEREEIESHVVHTYNFLRQIPWGRTYKDIPLIAGAHHEKLNGSGYPRGLTAEEIPAPTKMMTISDIYDALTARDRPYKKAVPEARALQILEFEVKDGHLDRDLYEIFIEAEVYKIVRSGTD